MPIAPPISRKYRHGQDEYAQYQALVATTNGFETLLAELNAAEVSSTEARALHMTDFGELPLIVLSAGLGESIPSFTESENQQLWENLQIEQTDLTALSSKGKQIMAEQSGHYIQLNQPDLVINAIKKIVDALRERSA